MGQNVLMMGKSILDRATTVDIVALPNTGALAVADNNDVAIAEGKAYLLTGKYLALAVGASIYMLMDGNGLPGFHFHDFSVSAIGSPITVEFYEDPTVTANGTSVAGVNMNRMVATSPTALTYIGSTVTVDGTLMGSGEILGVTTAKNAIGKAELGSNWILDPTKLYIFKFTNNDNQIVDLNFNFQWHEHEA